MDDSIVTIDDLIIYANKYCGLKLVVEHSPNSKPFEEIFGKECKYYKENGKMPCCTHMCEGCMWYE